MLVHAIGADRWLEDLSMESKFDTDWHFLCELKGRGERAADAWLTCGLEDVGVRSSADIRGDYLMGA